MVVVAGVTFIDVPVTAPMPGAILIPHGPDTDHDSVVDCPGCSVDGVATKLVIEGGAPAVTATVAVAVPKAFVAVSVYAVVVCGYTVTDVPATDPTPLMVTVGEPVTTQLNVLGCPATTFVADAVKLAMTGGLPTDTGVAATALPKAFVAVSV